MPRWILVGLLLSLGLAVLLASGTAVAVDQEHPPPDEASTTTHVSISIQSGQYDDEIGILVTWQTSYPARSATEADRARNESLDVDWHQGVAYVQSLQNRHPGSWIDNNGTRIRFDPSDESEHGGITVATDVRWVGPFNENDRVEFGPGLWTRLSHGDRVTIVVPDTWSVENASVEANRERGHDYYTWTIGSDPDPHFVLTDESVPNDPLLSDQDWERIGIVIWILVIGGIVAAVGWDRRRES